MPAMGGNPLALEMARHKGMAIKNIKKPETLSVFQFSFNGDIAATCFQLKISAHIAYRSIVGAAEGKRFRQLNVIGQ